MIGIILNTIAIVVGSIAGALLGKGIRENYKRGVYDALGLAAIAIGLNATISHLPKSQHPVLFIVALTLGSAVGTWLNIDERFHRFVEKQSKASSSTAKERSLANGLSTAILLYCVGPLSMLGPVMSALQSDHTFLFTNAMLDLVTSIVFASTYGFGMVLAAPVLFLWQGLFYAVALLSSQAISDALMTELLIIGGLMITGSGLTLLQLKDCQTLNLLPALAIPVIWFFFEHFLCRISFLL